MSVYEYAVIAESVFGNQNACSETADGEHVDVRVDEEAA